MKGADKEFRLMQAFVESQVIQDIDLVVEFLEMSLEADKEVCNLAQHTMAEDAFYKRKISQCRIESLILKLK
jgi:hypothetical protein